MSDLEYAGLVLEDQLLDHLATPEGALAVWKERLDPDVIPDSDAGIREALMFVQRYIDEYREPPSPDVLADETGYSEFNEPVAPVGYIIERLRDRYRRKTLKQVVTKIGRLSNEPVEAVTYGIEQFESIRAKTQIKGNTITELDFQTTLDDYDVSLEAMEKSNISFGYPEIDSHLGGLRLGEVVVILARPKRYKSWQLDKSLVSTFMAGHNVAMATMEMAEPVMRDRIHCMIAGVSWYRFQHKILTDQEAQKMVTVAEIMQEQGSKLSLFRPKIGERTVANLVAQAKEVGAEVLYIDQLSWFDGAKDEGNWRIIGTIMEQLKDASMNFPIYMAAQLNREAANVTGLADLAQVGLADAIGQTADTLLGIYASKDMLSNKLIHLGIMDSRSFEPVTWEIKVRLSEESNFQFLNVVDNE